MFKLATDPPAFPCTQPSNPPKILLLNVTGKIEEKNYECISDNSCNSIRRKKTKK